MKKKRVYVAGPLNAMAVDYLHNVYSMMMWAETIRKRGYSVYVPALDLLMGIVWGYRQYEDYFDNSQPWLEVTDYLFTCPGWENSQGTQKEMATAKRLGIPIIKDIDDLPEVTP